MVQLTLLSIVHLLNSLEMDLIVSMEAMVVYLNFIGNGSGRLCGTFGHNSPCFRTSCCSSCELTMRSELRDQIYIKSRLCPVFFSFDFEGFELLRLTMRYKLRAFVCRSTKSTRCTAEKYTL